MADKQKKRENRALRIAENVEPLVETHRQVFARLSDQRFNSGWMHNTPGKKKERHG